MNIVSCHDDYRKSVSPISYFIITRHHCRLLNSAAMLILLLLLGIIAGSRRRGKTRLKFMSVGWLAEEGEEEDRVFCLYSRLGSERNVGQYKCSTQSSTVVLSNILTYCSANIQALDFFLLTVVVGPSRKPPWVFILHTQQVDHSQGFWFYF